jgi:hypothetical protein
MFDKAAGTRDCSITVGVISVTHPRPNQLKKHPEYSSRVNDVEGSRKISKPKVLEALHHPKLYKDWLTVIEQYEG